MLPLRCLPVRSHVLPAFVSGSVASVLTASGSLSPRNFASPVSQAPLSDAEQALGPVPETVKRSIPETVADILKWKSAGSVSLFQISEDATVQTALDQMLDNRVTCVLAIKDNGKVAGLMTERDVLRGLHSRGSEILELAVCDIMTPARKLLFGTPEMSIEQCSIILNERKIRNLPVVSNGQIQGMIGLRDLSWATHVHVLGSKESAVRNTLKLRGLDSSVSLPSGLDLEVRSKLQIVGGAFCLPNAHKDVDGSEDAHFMLQGMEWPPTGDTALTYFGVADGVGSWRERGVDPRMFSRRLMELCEATIRGISEKHWDRPFPELPPSPHYTLHAAWEQIVQEEVIGSCTAMLAMLDVSRSQLVATNIGDSGLMVLRDSNVSQIGSLAHKRVLDNEGWHIHYRSAQQLHDFNQPYQLGWAPGDEALFETPIDANLMRLPVEDGDIVLMASDGLFDNVFEKEIMDVVQDWAIDREVFDEAAHVECAQRLCEIAREHSLNRNRVSPFANLANENDILWSGGMPDDCTVVVGTVCKVDEDDPSTSH